MRTTIVMLSVDERAMLEHSLPRALAQGADEVVVVDNASQDGTATLVTESGARLLRLHERVSYAAAINHGLQQTDADAVLLLNADCFVEPGFLAALLHHLERRRVGSVAPRLIRALGPEPAQRLEELDAAGMFVDRRRKNGLTGHGAPLTAYRHPGECFGADGAAALYRRDVLDACAVGAEVLDEDMALWASDVDLAWRARLLGWRCAYEPAAVGYHVRSYSPSTRSGLAAGHRRVQFRNRLVMIAKNATWADTWRDLPRIATYEIAALGYALLRERELLRGYADAARMLRGARRRRRAIMARRDRAGRPPFGLLPPA